MSKGHSILWHWLLLHWNTSNQVLFSTQLRKGFILTSVSVNFPKTTSHFVWILESIFRYFYDLCDMTTRWQGSELNLIHLKVPLWSIPLKKNGSLPWKQLRRTQQQSITGLSMIRKGSQRSPCETPISVRKFCKARRSASPTAVLICKIPLR